MKFILPNTVLKAVVLVSLFSLTFCNKVNDLLHQRPGCEVRQYTYSHLSTQLPYLYQKRYDPSGKFLQVISLSYNGVGIPLIKDLRLQNYNRKLLLIDVADPVDTTYTIEFNALGRPHSILWATSYERLQLFFTYKNNRLDSIKFSNRDYQADVCYYDNQGNIKSIKYYLAEYGQYAGTFYEYDYTRTAKNQIYFDEITGETLFPLLLLRYLDFFPELNPTNIRVRSSSGLENVYYLCRNYLFNHRIDPDGKLLGYDLGPVAGEINSQVTVDWRCDKTPSDWQTQK